MASKLNRIGKDIMSAMKNATEQGTSAYDTTAEVRRIEGDIAWVHIAGGVDETPVKLTIAAKAGDSVQVRVGGGRAWITGNATAPPTDDRQANIATEKAEFADTKVVIAQETADTAKKIADTAKEIAGDTNQYFWHTESGTDTGAHITEKTQEEFLDDPQNGGGNLLARSNGIAVRDGLAELATFGADGSVTKLLGVPVFVVNSSGASESASYSSWVELQKAGTDGDRTAYTLDLPIDKALISSVHLFGDSGGVGSDADLTYGVASSGQIGGASIGYEYDGDLTILLLNLNPTTFASVQISVSGTFNAPYFSLGTRMGAIGAYSAVIGKGLIASHPEQLVLGKYNNNESTDIFEIGNGTADNARSNALTVDWNGNIVASGGLTLNGNKTMTDFVTAQGYTKGGTGNHTWYYRKWASGMEEAWGVCSANAVTGSVWASPIYYYDWTVTYPSMFTSAPTQCYITSRNDQWIPVGHGTPTKTGSYIRMMKPSSNAQPLAVDIYLVHR